MQTNLTLKIFAAIAVAVSLVASAQAVVPRLELGEESTFAISRMTALPKLDGVIDPSEWRDAVAVSGTVDMATDLLDPRPATFFLAWDADHLYLACRVYLRAGYKPQVSGGRAPDGADCFDDGLELLFKPLGKNVSNQNHATEFKLNMSSLGYGGTYTRLVVGQVMSNWEPTIKSASRTTALGTAPDGGTWWELETAFSTADFELVGDNQAGDQWKMMLGINHLPAVGWMQARIPCVAGYFTPQGKSVATLVENTPAVQMTMDSLSNLAADGTANLTVKAHNPGKTAAQIKVSVDVAGKIVKTETLDLPAGGEKAVSLNEKLPADVKEGRLTVRATYGDRTLLSYAANFQVGAYHDRLQPVPAPNPNAFPFSVKFNPIRGLVQIHGDGYPLPDPQAVKALKYEIKHQETGKSVAVGEITKAIAWNYDEIVTLKDLVAGTYEATARFLLKDGTVFGPQSGAFSKKDEAHVFSAWWGKDAGNSERVMAPFTAITRQGNRFSCWGRAYQLRSLGLPNAVSSQNGSVLAAPARVVVTVGGKETVIPLGEPTIADAKDWRVRFTGNAEGAGLAFSALGWMEQDGMVSVELTYQPKDGKSITVDALRIEYPVANEVAECLTSVGPGNNFAPLTTIVLPTDKQGRLWTVFDAGRKGAQMKVGSFYPHVWLGSDRRGFQWWADNDKGWFPDDDVPAHEVAREGAAVVLKNHIIGKPVTLTEPRTLSFTWMASPFKPLPKGWRMISATDDGTFFQPHRSIRINPKTGKLFHDPSTGQNVNWIHPESEDPAEWSALWAEQKTKGFGNFPAADQVVRERRPFDLYDSRTGVSFQHMSFQLIGYGHKSIEDEVFAYFGEEWYTGYDTWNDTYTDYAMYLLDRAFGEGGVVSTYWDLSFPILFPSPLSGLSYRLPDGRMQSGYNSLNCRRFYQRLWAVQDKHGLNPGSVGSHSTQSYIFPSLPWIDAVLDGERDWNLDASDMDWIDYYPQERMRALSCPHNWGVGICWMGNYTSTDPKKIMTAREKQAEYLWMHDSWLNPYMYPAMHMRKMPTSILDWGLNEESVVHHPYWRNPFVKCDDPEIMLTLWQIPDEQRVVLGVYNYGRKATKDAVIKLDLEKLGLAQKQAMALVLHQPEGAASEFDAANRTLTLKALPPHRGIFIGLAAPDAVETDRATKKIPAWITGGQPASIVNFGLARKETQHFAPGNAPGVVCDDASIQVGMWQLPDRILLTVYNTDGAVVKDVSIKVDLATLGLTPRLPWQDFIGVRNLHAEEKAPESILDFYGNTLSLKTIPPKAGRLVAIRRY